MAVCTILFHGQMGLEGLVVCAVSGGERVRCV